uniref:Uncharacterized protein n=1 Tax=Arundo donax TaxID=35708 RepID=A0A0A9B5D5_ARUDO
MQCTSTVQGAKRTEAPAAPPRCARVPPALKPHSIVGLELHGYEGMAFVPPHLWSLLFPLLLAVVTVAGRRGSPSSDWRLCKGL